LDYRYEMQCRLVKLSFLLPHPSLSNGRGYIALN
jgi:hypothetical protein